MQENDKQLKTKKNNNADETDKVEMLQNSNSESYQIMKNQTPKINSQGQKTLINYEDNKNIDNDNIIISKTLERTDSLKLYKKHKKEKEDKNNNLINVNKKGIIRKESLFKKQAKSNNGNKKENKRVTFLEPEFLTIIDVESYKKFNAENTCKDPFEDLDYLNNLNNLNNYNINININNNKKNEENDGKERINCTCVCNIS